MLVRKDDSSAHVEGECPGYLYLRSEYGRQPWPGAVETLVSDFASKHQLWQDLGPSKDLIYVYEDVIISNLSSGGSPPFNWSVS